MWGKDEDDSPWDLYRAIKPMYYLSRAFGLTPVRYIRLEGGSGYGLRTSVWATLWSALLCCALVLSAVLYLSWAALEVYASLLDRKAVLTDILRTVLIYGSVAVAVGGSAALQRGRAGRLLAAVAAVDRCFGLATPARYRRTRRALRAQLAALAALLAAALAYEAYCRTATFDQPADWAFHYFLTVYPVAFSVCAEAQFVNVVLLLRSRFSAVNAALEQRLAAVRSRRAAAAAEDPLAEDAVSEADDLPGESWPSLLTLCRAHDSLCSSVAAANACYGPQLLLALTYLFVDVVCLVYYSFAHGARLYAHWLLLDGGRLLALAVSCKRCSAAAHHAGTLVSRLLLEKLGVGARRQLTRFALQLQMGQLAGAARFTALGLLTLDGPLLTAMAGAVATYLVILLQYKTDEAPKP